MQPLATTRLMMMWLSMCPADESTTVRQKTVYVAHTWAVFMLNLFGFVANMVFIFKNVSIDFDGAMFAIMGAIGQVGLIYVHVVAIQMCRQIGNIFTSLSTIYENCKFIVIQSLKNCENRKILKKISNAHRWK